MSAQCSACRRKRPGRFGWGWRVGICEQCGRRGYVPKPVDVSDGRGWDEACGLGPETEARFGMEVSDE